MNRLMYVVFAGLVCITLTGCKSAADKCLGTGLSTTELAHCEEGCNDSSLPNHEQGESCYFAGMIYKSGLQLKKHDENKAKQRFMKACKLGSSSGCRQFRALKKR
jgi:hypothetical protein